MYLQFRVFLTLFLNIDALQIAQIGSKREKVVQKVWEVRQQVLEVLGADDQTLSIQVKKALKFSSIAFITINNRTLVRPQKNLACQSHNKLQFKLWQHNRCPTSKYTNSEMFVKFEFRLLSHDRFHFDRGKKINLSKVAGPGASGNRNSSGGSRIASGNHISGHFLGTAQMPIRQLMSSEKHSGQQT